MTEVRCSGCKNIFACDGINPKTKKPYKSRLTCRARNTNWKQLLFGKSNNDTSAADNDASLSLSETESNATDQALPPEIDHRTDQKIQPEVNEATTSHVTEPQIT